MYKFKKNNETKKMELVKINMNVHPSVIDANTFDNIFTREYARFEYYQIKSKINNGISTVEDENKFELIVENIEDFKTSSTTINDIPDELKPLMILTLFAHGKLLKSYEQDKEGECHIKTEKIQLGLSDFYNKCKTLIPRIETGAISLEEAINTIKPLYNDATKIVNHKAIDGICKKWEESTKEKCTKAFVIGLLSRYKITRSNRIKADSPLKSIASFEKYFAMWVVSGGAMVNEKKQNKDTTELFTSYCNRK